MTTGDDLKADGMARAESAQRVQAWRADAATALEVLASTHDRFTVDDLVALVGLPDTGTNANNVVGAVMSGAAKRGRIRRVGYAKAERAKSHARAVSVWRGYP